jgi:putative hydrolase of the HAD superfamily
MDVKNIIFDMGGVIIDFRPEFTLKKYFDSEKDRELILQNVFKSSVWQDMDRGIATDEQMMEYACAHLPPPLHKKVCHLLENWFDEMPPKKGMYEVVQTLKENGYKIYLLSNVSKSFYSQKDNIPAFSLFDGFLISADYLLLKPEKEIYEKLFEVFISNLKNVFLLTICRRMWTVRQMPEWQAIAFRMATSKNSRQQ